MWRWARWHAMREWGGRGLARDAETTEPRGPSPPPSLLTESGVVPPFSQNKIRACHSASGCQRPARTWSRGMTPLPALPCPGHPPGPGELTLSPVSDYKQGWANLGPAKEMDERTRNGASLILNPGAP